MKNKVVKKKVDADDNPSDHKNLQAGKIKKSVVNSEERQTRWFFVIVGVVFAVIFVSYFLNENSKNFEYGGVNWNFEEDVNYYHGIFMISVTDSKKLMYNIYVRNDPRENNVRTEGVFDKFRYDAVISTSPEFDLCRGEASRVMRDLGGFLDTAVGVNSLVSGSTDKIIANESNRLFAQCDTFPNKTVVVVDIGNSSVIQNTRNPFCYTIYVDNCNDASSVEKFMLKSIEDSKEEN